MKKNKMRILALLLALATFVSMFPGMAVYSVEGAEPDYVINNVFQLLGLVEKSIKENHTFAGETIQLNADIDLSAPLTSETGLSYPDAYGYIAAHMNAIQDQARISFNPDDDFPFMGEFDGNGHSISGMKYDISGSSASSKSDTGLFAFTQNAYVHDLVIKDSIVDADYRGGVLVGYARNSRFENISIRDTTLTLYCYNVVLTLGSDGGLMGGVLAGRADDCYIYNCEANGCTVSTNTTSGVEAASGKGMYLGGLVGSMEGGVLEYSRVQDSITRNPDGEDTVTRQSLIKIHYDVAVGALGGITAYAGGIIGEMKNGAFCIDSFSTAKMDVYTATYVSVGGGNSGHIGGIAAAVWGKSCEIQRCHFAGKAVSKQYNAVLVIPIIQNNKNISGLVAKFDGGSVTDAYFLPIPGIDMEVLGSKTSTTSYGPKDAATYANQNFWESNLYDFSGTIQRQNFYDYGINDEVYDHVNKWVMDTKLGIPVHGYSVAAAFDFPGAGAMSIDATNLMGAASESAEPLKPAIQGFTSMESEISAEMTLNPGFQIVRWYQKRDFTGTIFSSYDILERQKVTPLTSNANYVIENYNKSLTVTGVILPDDPTGTPTNALNDNDLYIADVQANVEFVDSFGSKTLPNSWYDYLDPLPDVTPTAPDASATFLGWTTDKAYDAIKAAELDALKQAGSFYVAGDPVEKPMTLYPVFANLISNVAVAIEGYGSDQTTRSDGELLVGNVAVYQDRDGRFYIDLTEFAGEDNGYRFRGWYTGCGEGNAYPGGIRASDDMKFYLDDYDLTQYDAENPLLFVAKMEYRVDYYGTTTKLTEESLAGNPFVNPFAQVWHTYNQNFVDVSGDVPLDESDIFHSWREGRGGLDHEDCNCTEVTTELKITKPEIVHAKVTGESTLYDVILITDFPGSATLTSGGSSASAIPENQFWVAIQKNDGYNFLCWDRDSSSYPANFRSTSTNSRWGEHYFAYTTRQFSFVAHMTANVVFHHKVNDPVTVTRRYKESVFLNSDSVYTYQYYLSKVSTGISNTSVASPTDASMAVNGYFFLGWINVDEVPVGSNEWNYIYDVHDDAYCTSDAKRVLPYIMDGTEICTKPMTLYPVYIRNATVQTSTNIHEKGITDTDPIIARPALPVYTTGAQDAVNGNIAGKITAETDKTEVLKNNADTATYRLLSVDVYVDGEYAGRLNEAGKFQLNGQEYTVTTGAQQWDINSTVIPNHDYYFVANYEPLVVIYHTDADKTEAYVRNTGDALGAQPAPVMQAGSVFLGWTDQNPTGDAWYVTKANAPIIGPATVVGQSMELWPVFSGFDVDVDSNIDSTVGTDHRRVEHKSGERSAVLEADPAEGYAFKGWYTGWDGTNGTLISESMIHTIEGADILNGQLYTAVYLSTYTIYYHDTDGSILETVYLDSDDTRTFVQTVTDDKGTDDSADDIITQVPVDQSAFLAIFENMEENQVFESWYWLAGNDRIAWEDFANKDAVGSMKEKTTKVMHLYPIILEATATDSNGEAITVVSKESTQIKDGKEIVILNEADLQFSFKLSTEYLLDAYMNFPAVDKDGNPIPDTEWYAQPKLTVKVVRKTYSSGGTMSQNFVDISVNLYEDKVIAEDQSPVPMETGAILAADGTGTIDFYFYGKITVKKVLEGSNEPFLFTVTSYDPETLTYSGTSRTIAVDANEDGVTIILPCGYYGVQEHSSWAWKYDASLTVNGKADADGIADVTLSVGRDGTADSAMEIICTNTQKQDDSNWFCSFHRITNIFTDPDTPEGGPRDEK